MGGSGICRAALALAFIVAPSGCSGAIEGDEPGGSRAEASNVGGCADREPDGGGPSVQLATPMDRQVFQRSGRVGQLVVTGVVAGGPADCVDVQVKATDSGQVLVPWTLIPSAGTSFAGRVQVGQGGWYTVTVRARRAGRFGQAAVGRVGVGEVFLTAGQSNSANSGEYHFPAHDQVSAWNGSGWQEANDPQPIAAGTGGSTWAALGNILERELGVPIGFVSVGVGGTHVAAWVPGAPLWEGYSAPLYDRIAEEAMTFNAGGGIRAILWHQGESDSAQRTPAETYCQDLSSIIQTVRGQIGYPVAWLVAHATALYAPPVGRSRTRLGQSCAIHRNPNTFPGPDTDLLGYDVRRSDATHFSRQGQHQAARLWANAIEAVVR
jgi:hypothetical protein